MPPDVRDNVLALGYVSDAVLPDFYAGLDYYLCLSRYEGVPYPVLEAMSSGVVVLSTPVGVVDELVKSGENGLVLSSEDAASEAIIAIDQTARDSTARLRMGREARASVCRAYDWKRLSAADILSAYAIGMRKRDSLRVLGRAGRAMAAAALKSLRRGAHLWAEGSGEMA